MSGFALSGRRVAGMLVATVALVALRAGSLTPLRTATVGESVLRLSWTARPEHIEQCRRLTDAEFAERPQHMRLRWECEGRFARYLLTVTVDDRAVAADTVRGGGLRNDRPMHLFREFALTPGSHRVEVSLRRLDVGTPRDSTSQETAAGAAAADRETREGQERRARRAEALPELISLDSTLVVQPRHVVLVSYASTARRLVLRNGP